jgi:DNA-binding transcriptional regulator YdaS (Cro superfamily)
MARVTTKKIIRPPGLAAAIEAAGGVRALARLLGIQHSAVVEWARIPADRIIEIEKATGVPRHKLRPDIFIGYSRNDEQRARKIVKEAIRQL